jgi:integrase
VKKSTRAGTSRKALTKPKKPYAEFPLTPRASGKWMKKIRGQIHYFGQWAKRLEGVLTRVDNDGWEAALEEYKKVADDLHAGRTPRVQGDGLTVKDLCNHFLTAKLRKMDAGELTSLLFYDYKVITDFLVENLGGNRLVDDLAADDFAALRAAMAKKWGPVRLANSITRTKSVFKHGYETGLMDRPVRYGPEFAKPSASVLRRHRANRPAKILEANEVRALIDGAGVVGKTGPEWVEPNLALRAMILLGVNCGFGNADCAELPTSAVNLDSGWINFPRPKTGIARRCPLWPETIVAIRAAVDVRPKPALPRDVGRMFLSEAGTMLVTRTEKGNTKDLVGTHFTNLLTALKLHHKQLGFYTLRRVFETIAGGAKDQVAVDLIMGHVDGSMAANYRERVDDSRLRAVVDHVRAWLWPSA